MNVISITGPTENEEAIRETAASSIRAEIAKRVALGGGWSVGVMIVYGAYQLLRSDPHDAFPLLNSWGPKAIGGLLIIYVVYDIVKMLLNAGMRMVHAVEKMAVAQQMAASKDDRQVQEMQTLTSYTSQQSEKSYQKMMEISETLGRSIPQLTTLATALDAVHKRIDALTAGLVKRDG